MESTSSFGNETLTMGMCPCHNNFQLTAYIRVIKIQKILNNSIPISRAVIPLLPEWIVLLLGSLGLGMLHGVIPDEHTWPITFSYSVGSATGRGGMLSGGFFAGFGVDTGLFTTFIYLVAVPAMPVAYLGFAPGAAFGFGTLIVLLAIGTLFGGVLQIAKKWGPERIQLFGTRAGARSLLYGGIIFIIAGILFRTGIQDTIPLDFGNLIVLAFMIGAIIPVMIFTWREVKASPTPHVLTAHR